MRYFVKVVDKLSDMGGALAGILVFVLTAPIFVSVITRRFFNNPMTLIDEVSGYLMVGIVFIALAYTLKQKGHIAMTAVVDHLPVKVRRKVEVIMPILAFGWFIPLLWGVSAYWYTIYEEGKISIQPSQIEVWIPAIIVPIGVALFMLQVIVEMIKRGKSGGA